VADFHYNADLQDGEDRQFELEELQRKLTQRFVSIMCYSDQEPKNFAKLSPREKRVYVKNPVLEMAFEFGKSGYDKIRRSYDLRKKGRPLKGIFEVRRLQTPDIDPELLYKSLKGDPDARNSLTKEQISIYRYGDYNQCRWTCWLRRVPSQDSRYNDIIEKLFKRT